MAITFVQGTGQNITSGTTNAKAYGSTLTSGSYLLAFVLSLNTGQTAPTASVADSAGNAWSQLVFKDFGGTASKMYVFGAPNTHGAVADTVTATHSSAVSLSVLGILEYTGVFNGSPTDITGTFLDATGTSYTGSPVTTTRLNDVVLGFGYNGAAGVAITPGANQTTRFNGATVSSVLAMDQPAATTGSYTPSCTIASSQELALATIALASVAPSATGGSWVQGHRAFVNKRGYVRSR